MAAFDWESDSEHLENFTLTKQQQHSADSTTDEEEWPSLGPTLAGADLVDTPELTTQQKPSYLQVAQKEKEPRTDQKKPDPWPALSDTIVSRGQTPVWPAVDKREAFSSSNKQETEDTILTADWLNSLLKLGRAAEHSNSIDLPQEQSAPKESWPSLGDHSHGEW